MKNDRGKFILKAGEALMSFLPIGNHDFLLKVIDCYYKKDYLKTNKEDQNCFDDDIKDFLGGIFKKGK